MKAGRPVGTYKRIHPTRIGGKLTKSYRTWTGMIARCYNPKHPTYKYYGGKGVKVCDRWNCKDGYDNFVLDVGVAPDGMWIERKDNSKGYQPDNCCWATPKEQAGNREQGGKKCARPMTIMSLCNVLGIKYSMVYQRIVLRGWSYNDAFATPRL